MTYKSLLQPGNIQDKKILNHIHKAVFIKEKTFLGFIIIKHQKTLYANSGYQYILRQYIFQRGNEKESRDFPGDPRCKFQPSKTKF